MSDVDHARNAEEAINYLIERRAQEISNANAAAREQAESLRRYNLRGAAERRAAWAEFYRTQIAAAESWRERAAANLARIIDGR